LVLFFKKERLPLIHGALESLGPDGFTGWLRDTESATPAIVRIATAGQIVAQAAARLFRPDLLARGQHHGHYGFNAHLAVALPPGPAAFDLSCNGQTTRITARLTVPAIAPPAPVPVESLLRGPPAWKTADLAANPACIDASAQRRLMGTARFVDVTFRFVLRRWPSRDEARVFAAALDEERLSPPGFLIELLGSRERADLGPALPSPWDADFPFAHTAPAAPPPILAAPARRRKGAA
jgi:hypothetical protein